MRKNFHPKWKFSCRSWNLSQYWNRLRVSCKLLLQFKLQQCRENEHNLMLTEKKKTLIKTFEATSLCGALKVSIESFDSFQSLIESHCARIVGRPTSWFLPFHLSSFCWRFQSRQLQQKHRNHIRNVNATCDRTSMTPEIAQWLILRSTGLQLKIINLRTQPNSTVAITRLVFCVAQFRFSRFSCCSTLLDVRFALQSLTSLAVCSKDLINLIVVVDETSLIAGVIASMKIWWTWLTTIVVVR